MPIRGKRMLAERLRDPEFGAEYERVCAAMFERLAPATEGPVVNPGVSAAAGSSSATPTNNP